MTKNKTVFRSNIPLSIEQKLASIGLMVSANEADFKQLREVDIEQTLIEAISCFGSDEAFLRYLNPVFTWIEEHGSAVIVEKFVKLLFNRQLQGKDIAYSFLMAKFAEHVGLRRWNQILKLKPNPDHLRYVGPADICESFIKLRGEEEWSKGSGFKLPKGIILLNKKWILSRSSLAKLNHQYRNRLIYGAQWRSDIITVIERGVTTPIEVSRISGASYEPCHRILADLTDAGKLPTRQKLIRA